jgi:N-acetylglucosaminyldiphosphoundecaprenol N-acetyl-beta-D-mannosaminyltransferase
MLPDGVPMVWALRLFGASQASRVRVSPDFLIELLGRAECGGITLGLYGGTDETLAALRSLLEREFPGLTVAFSYGPPFRPLTPEEDAAVVDEIDASGAQLLLIGIGCPKQEKWMASHRQQLSCVMFGVGAAFDLFGGKTREAPRWMQPLGLEWVFRLLLEPRRLWRRHLRHNPRFVVLLARGVLARWWAARCTNP